MPPPAVQVGELVNIEAVVEVTDVVLLGSGVPVVIPVPHGGFIDGMLRVDGGRTREADDEDKDDNMLEVGNALLDDLAVGEGMNDIDKLDDISAGISLLPSSSSSESGARVQAGASEDDGCSLSPSSSSNDKGAREQDGPSVVLEGRSLSPSSLSRLSGAREQAGASLLLEVVVKLETVVVVVVPRMPQPV
jgi:hypothetical protein